MKFVLGPWETDGRGLGALGEFLEARLESWRKLLSREAAL